MGAHLESSYDNKRLCSKAMEVTFLVPICMGGIFGTHEITGESKQAMAAGEM